jgi:hypothetical protein
MSYEEEYVYSHFHKLSIFLPEKSLISLSQDYLSELQAGGNHLRHLLGNDRLRRCDLNREHFSWYCNTPLWWIPGCSRYGNSDR